MLGQNVPPCLIGTCCGDECGDDVKLCIELSDDSENSEDENQCSNNCESVCCGNIMTIYSQVSAKDYESSNQDAIDSKYSFQYSFLFNSGVWHPPSA